MDLSFSQYVTAIAIPVALVAFIGVTLALLKIVLDNEDDEP